MRPIRFVAAALVAAAIATPAFADVTLRIKQTGTGGVTDVTEYRKGLKMRTDSSGAAVPAMSTIVDAGSSRSMVMLWHDGKIAHVVDSTPKPPRPDEGIPEVKQSLTPTGQSREIAGSTCVVYEVKQSLRQRKGSETVTYAVEGSVCLVKNPPGQADFAQLHRADSAVVDDPMREVRTNMAELGVPFATAFTLRLGGTGPGETMTTIGTYTTEVVSISTAPIPDAMFGIPADYTVVKR